MMLGHAAGAAASLAAERNVAVQDIPYPLLREQLLSQKQILDYVAPKPFASDSAGVAKAGAASANDALERNLQVLLEREIISDAEYWRAHAVKGKTCDGDQVAHLFVSMAGAFQPVEKVDEAIPVLIENRLFGSRDYWTPRAVSGGHCSGELVAGVIDKFIARTMAKR